MSENEQQEAQLTLVEGTIPRPNYRRLKLADLPANDELISPEPRPGMISSVAMVGVLQPIVVEKLEDGYHVESGRRRIKASRMNELKDIPAMVYPEGSGLRNIGTVHENEIRSPNEVTSFLAIETLMSEKSVKDPREIATALGVNQKRVNKLMRLRELTPGLLELFKQRRVSPSAAFIAVKLPSQVQGGLVKKLKDDEGGRLTIEMAREARQAHTAKEMAALGNDAFGTPSAAEAGSVPAYPIRFDGETVAESLEEARAEIERVVFDVPWTHRAVTDAFGKTWEARVQITLTMEPIDAAESSENEDEGAEAEEE